MFPKIKSTLALGIALVASGAIFSACERSGEINEVYFTENAKVYDLTDRLTDTIFGQPVIKGIIGSWSLCSINTILCFPTSDHDAMFSFYSHSGDSLGSFGKLGQGPNDFLTAWTQGMRYDKGDDIGLWVIDVNSSRLKTLNISKSFREGMATVDTSFAIDPMVFNAFYHDGKIIESAATQNNYELRILSSDDQTILYREPLFKINFSPNPIMAAYYCDMGLSPDGRYIVMSMTALNEINILDLADYSRLTISVGNVPQKDEVFGSDGITKRYDTVLTLSDCHIITLYEHGSYITQENKANSSLHVFDYAGNFIANIPVDRYLISITYSKEDDCIYALDENENVIRYQMNLKSDSQKN